MRDIRPLFIAIPNPNGTGGEIRSWQILNSMAKQGVDMRVIIDEFTKTPPSSTLFQYRKLKGQLSSIFAEGTGLSYIVRLAAVYKLVKALRTEINDFKPDIVVAHNETAWNIESVYLASGKIPWTVIIQEIPLGLNYSIPWTLKVVSSFSKYKRFLKIFLGRRAMSDLKKTTPILISDAINSEMCIIGQGLKKYISLNVPVGLDLDIIQKATSSRFLFDALFMSRLIPEKGIFDLVYVWRFVTMTNKKAILCILGNFVKKSDQIKMKKLIREYNLEKNIVFKGYLDGESKYSFIKSARLFLYPSRGDSFSIAVLEALSCGLPVVAYKIPAMIMNFKVSAVIKTEIGNHQQMAEVVLNLIRDERLRKTISKEAVTFTKNFNWDYAARSEIEAYLKILSDKNA